MSHHVVAKGTTRDHDEYHPPQPNVHGWLPLGQIFHLSVEQF